MEEERGGKKEREGKKEEFIHPPLCNPCILISKEQREGMKLEKSALYVGVEDVKQIKLK